MKAVGVQVLLLEIRIIYLGMELLIAVHMNVLIHMLLQEIL